jgi:YgiT-type zinc finger domain-containing protein
MRSALVKTSIWIDERLFVVEDIPAQVCDSCIEQYYDESTTDALRRLTEEKFPADEVKREMVVPVYSLTRRILQRVAPPDYESY